MSEEKTSLFRCVVGMALASVAVAAHATCVTVSNTGSCTGGTNAASINVPGTGTDGVTVAGSPYPSTLTVAGGSGTVSSVVLRLNGYTSLIGASVGNASRNVGILLVSPSGRNLQVMRAVGSPASAQTNLVVALQDFNTALPNQSSPWTFSGTFQPTAYDGPGSPDYTVDGGPSMAHSAAPLGTSTLASVFAGDVVNGTWKLYLVDDAAAANVKFSSWDLSITFIPPSITSTTVLAAACPTTFAAGDSFTMIATVIGASPTGSVSFFDGVSAIDDCASVPLLAQKAVCATAALLPGTRDLSADYSGDAINMSSISAPLTVNVLDPADAVFLNGFEECGFP